MAAWETYWLKKPRGTRGVAGDDGTAVDTGDWVVDTAYLEGDRCYHAKSGYGQCVYRCKTGQSHTSTALDEPEVGANWETYWEMFAAGGADGAGSGDFSGIASSVTGNFVSFADTGGKAGADSGVGANDVNFYNLSESTAAIDPDGDFVKVWKASNSTYYKVHAQLLGRKTESIILTSQGMWPRDTNGCNAPDNVETSSVKRYLSRVGFPETAITYAEVDFALPWYYDGGTITVRFHWFMPTATSGNIRWGASGLVCGDGDALDAAEGTAQEVTDASQTTAYDLLISEPTPDITLAGSPGGGKVCIMTLYRDPTHVDDTIEETVYLKSVEIRYGCSE